MNRVVEVDEFDCKLFMGDHKNDIVIFVTGSWDYMTHTGAYTYLTCYQGKTARREAPLKDLKSSNVAMLLAAIDACIQVQLEKKQVFIITPTELGFQNGEKGKGINVEYIQKIKRICEQKQLQINSVAIRNGGAFLKKLVNGVRKITPKPYNKLVRDKIPEIIMSDGKTCDYRTLQDEEYAQMLDKKLDEELAEYQESKSLEELADLLEVMQAVVKARGWTLEQLEEVRAEKAAKRGGFEKKILLQKVME